MVRFSRPSGPSIGQGRKTREQIAQEKADAALAARGYSYRGVEPAPVGPGVIAIAVNGRHTIVHVGRDKADALFGLAALALRPEGRS